MTDTERGDHPLPEPNPPRIDPVTGLALPDPYPEYVTCPHCGEPEVEVFCYETQGRCHRCGQLFEHIPPVTCGQWPYCKRANPGELPNKKGAS